jgi:NAD(P)-dependent dehydrogenase (short-subunit alcohol dehydrogenase family)
MGLNGMCSIAGVLDCIHLTHSLSLHAHIDIDIDVNALRRIALDYVLCLVLVSIHINSTFATNYLGHYLFALHLIDALRRGAPARVVSVSSLTHTTASIPFDLLEYWAFLLADARAANPSLIKQVTGSAPPLADTLPCSYPWGKARGLEEIYRESKLANVLFAFEFNRRYSHLGIYANALCPGVVASDILRVCSSNVVLVVSK